MKTFLNVLYRRILYKIPLKLLLVILAVCAIFIASFSNAGFQTPVLLTTIDGRYSDKSYTNNNYDLLCIQNDTCTNSSLGFNRTHGDGAYYVNHAGDQGMACNTGHTLYYSTSNSCKFKIFGINIQNYTKAQCKSTYGLIEDSECVGMDSMTCQTTYNLIPISSVDQNYCTTNNLCPSCSTCPVCPTNTGLSLTDLYINNILHVGAPTIFMNIPEEIDRDYAYTNGGNIMNIDVFGYNVDYEKMQGVIDTQSYIPTEEDFQNIIAILTPYTKIIVFFVFLFIVWAWIKKPFKSKKL